MCYTSDSTKAQKTKKDKHHDQNRCHLQGTPGSAIGTPVAAGYQYRAESALIKLMNTLRLPALTRLKPSKTAVLVALAVLLVLATFVLGAVVRHQQEAATAAQTASTEQQLQSTKAELAALRTANTKLAAEGQAETNKSAQVCQYVRSVAPKYKLTVPTLCNQ